jgi:hypothetical protein
MGLSNMHHMNQKEQIFEKRKHNHLKHENSYTSMLPINHQMLWAEYLCLPINMLKS